MSLSAKWPFNRDGLRSLHCNGCTECCRVLAVKDIEKPAFTRCPHQINGGCAVHSEHPASCKSFHCAYVTRWLDGYGEAARPDRCKVIVWGMRGTRWGDIVAVSECVPGAASCGIGARIVRDLAAKQLVLVIGRRASRLTGPADQVAEARNKRLAPD